MTMLITCNISFPTHVHVCSHTKEGVTCVRTKQHQLFIFM